MSRIASNMIEVSTTGETVTLDKILKEADSIPITLWGEPTVENVNKAINYLKSIGGGSVKIPANADYNLLVIKVLWGKKEAEYPETSEMLVRYEYNDWRPPINKKDEDDVTIGEYRPYTNKSPWLVGDIIYNSDMGSSEDSTTQWYCCDSGDSVNPAGVWKYMSADVPSGQGAFSYNADTKTITWLRTEKIVPE